jgi:acyl carrier protein
MTVDELKSTLARILRLKEIDLTETMGKTRGWDSLRHIQLILELERVTAVQIPPELFGSLNTAQALMAFLRDNGALTEA